MIYKHYDQDDIYNDANHIVIRYIRQIDTLVTVSAQKALFLSNLDQQRPKQALWYDSAKRYIDRSNNNDSSDNNIPPFLYSYYGSAVEDLVNMQIKNIPCPSSIGIILQQQNSGTRPDIVIYFNQKSYAWLDITSQRNVGHIWRKANWFNNPRPFIAELLYENLSTTKIRETSEDHIGHYAHFNHTLRMHTLNERILMRHMMKCTNHALARLYGRLRKDTRKSVISDAFTFAFNLHSPYPCIHLCIKSILHRYRNSCDIMYQSTATEIYNRFYTDGTSQSWEKAQEMIKKSYQSTEACQP